MTGFPINPPRTAIADAQGNVTPEWYRYFAQIQKAIGGPSDPFEDGYFIGASGSPVTAIVAGLHEDRLEPNYGQLVARILATPAAAAGSLTVGSGECDFGATPTDYGTVTIVDAGISATSSVWAWIQGSDTTADNNAAMHTQAAIAFQLSPEAGAGSVTIEIACLVGFVTGKFKVRYAYQ